MLEYEFILGDTGNTNSTFTDKEKDIARIIVTTIEQMYLQLEIKFPNVKIQIRKYPADSATPMFCLAKIILLQKWTSLTLRLIVLAIGVKLSFNWGTK